MLKYRTLDFSVQIFVMYGFVDQAIIEANRRRYKRETSYDWEMENQPIPQQCRVCRQIFPSGNKHLSANSLHSADWSVVKFIDECQLFGYQCARLSYESFISEYSVGTISCGKMFTRKVIVLPEGCE